MVDSSSRSNKVISLVRKETSLPAPSNYGAFGGGSGGGGDIEQRLTFLEKQVREIYQTLSSISGVVDRIDGRTRVLDNPPSSEKVLLWIAGAMAALCAAYVFITPKFMDSALNDKMQKLDGAILRIEQGLNKNSNALESVSRIEKTVESYGDTLDLINKKIKKQ